MSMKTIVFSHNIPKEYYESYTKGLEVITPERPMECFTKDQAMEAVKDADIWICIGDYVCDRELIDAGTRLSVIGNMGSGYDNVDAAYAKEKGIRVLNAPSSVVESTAEMTVGLMMGICRGIVQYDRELRRDRVCTRQLFFHRDMVLYGKTLGVIGFGRIGQAVALKAHGLGMKIIFYQPVPAPKEAVKACGARAVSLEELLGQADVVTLHMPYTKETHHYMDKDKLAAMKGTAYLINASRGPVVEERALVDALKSNQIKGAALDVHEFEPSISQEIADLSNIVITPHCCTNIAEVRIGMLHELLDGIHCLLRGEAVSNLVC